VSKIPLQTGWVDPRPCVLVPPISGGCHGVCQVLDHLDGEKIVRVSGALTARPVADLFAQRVWLHPRCSIDPDRLKFPMRRTGARGENKQERISWDAAPCATCQESLQASLPVAPFAVKRRSRCREALKPSDFCNDRVKLDDQRRYFLHESYRSVKYGRSRSNPERH
jgi:hypothetical protein